MRHLQRGVPRRAIVLLVVGIVLGGLAPRWVVVPAPAAEYRPAVSVSLVEPTIAAIDAGIVVAAEAVRPFAAPAPRALVVVLLVLFLAPRTIRRELRLVLNRVRAPGSLLEIHISRAEGRTTWQRALDPPIAAWSGRPGSLGTIAV